MYENGGEVATPANLENMARHVLKERVETLRHVWSTMYLYYTDAKIQTQQDSLFEIYEKKFVECNAHYGMNNEEC